MKISYDSEVDVLKIELANNPIHESDENQSGVVLDYDRDGHIVSIEVFEASRRVDDPRTIEYRVSDP